MITVGSRRGQQATVPFIGFAEAFVLSAFRRAGETIGIEHALAARNLFPDGAEAFVLSAFRRAGVPLQRIRPAVEVLRETMGIEHALAARNLFTDGAEVLFDYAHERGQAELLELTVVRTGQKQFSELVRDHLTRIRYADDGWASMLELPAYRDATVVVDPSVRLVCHW